MKKKLKVDGIKCRHCRNDIQDVLMTSACVQEVRFEENFVILNLSEDMKEEEIVENIENCGNFKVLEIMTKEA